MTALPPPDPEQQQAITVTATTYLLVRAYLDGRGDWVLDADQRLHEVTAEAAAAHPADAEMFLQHQSVQDAELVLQEWLAITKGKIDPHDVLPAARQLVTVSAPPAIRGQLQEAFDRIIAGDAELISAAPAGLTGVTGGHLYAAVTAAVIAAMHPMTRNHARVLLEERRRGARTVGRGMPRAEAVTYISDAETDRVLLEVMPWVAEMTDRRHDAVNKDLRALVRLYLLDHAVVGAAEKAEIRQLIGKRFEELTGALAPRTLVPAPRIPAPPQPPPQTPEQLAARQAAERLRRGRKKRRP
jgi:hypothetical protein